jgi:hypothetical protein
MSVPCSLWLVYLSVKEKGYGSFNCNSFTRELTPHLR